MGAKSYTSAIEQLKPDPVYGSLLLSKFINCLMYDGKKATAQRVVYGAFKIIEQRVKDQKAIDVFENALNNVKPVIEVRSRRVGGANYQVPMAVGSQASAVAGDSLGARGVPLQRRQADARTPGGRTHLRIPQGRRTP